jgi:hypothetical protein
MSAQRINLKSKPVIAVVLSLLAIVVAVNVAVFKPGQRAPEPAKVRMQASQPMPVDLAEYRLESAASAENLAAWGERTNPALRRDPFGSIPIATEVVPAEIPDEPEIEVVPLTCNAILLGGVKPVAMIGGQSYRVGDRVDDQGVQYQVAAIGSTGVKLSSANGPGLFLSVHGTSRGAGRGRVITKSTNTNGLGITSLVEHARGERK